MAGRTVDGLCVPTTMIAKIGDDDDDDTKNEDHRPAAFVRITIITIIKRPPAFRGTTFRSQG